MGELEVLHPGLYSSIQDLGRNNFRKFGVPQSGVMDSYAAKKANLILSNSETDPVLEITQMGPKLKFYSPTRIAICGAALSPKINNIEFSNNKLIPVASGDILSFGKRIFGCRAYIAIAGGFISEKVLNSYSWYNEITESSILNKGMHLKYPEVKILSNRLNASLKVDTSYIRSNSIKVYKGPEHDLLSLSQKELLLNTEFTVDVSNNRMAIQLTEPLHNKLKPIITGPVLPGTVQLTPSGKLILLMRDCQTTGGYPRILHLSEDGINTISQKVTGESFKFQLNQELRGGPMRKGLK